MSELNLPAWATQAKDGAIEVKASVVYPMALERLAVTTVDQYWLEVARRCFTEHLHQIIQLDGEQNQLHLRIVSDTDAFLLKKNPKGAGAEEGGSKFRKHYKAYLRGQPKPKAKVD
jgi:hypothetical protein